MAPRTNITAPGITGGYVLAACLLILLWFGVGLLLLPVMAVLAVLHTLRGMSLTGIPRSHHLWLARHHAWATIALLLITAAVLVVIPMAIQSGMTIINTLVQAPNPIATLAAAWPALGLPQIATLGLLAFIGWLLVTLWLSIRLVTHWLRWVDRRKA